MKHAELWSQLTQMVPPHVSAKVQWVRERVHQQDIEVAFNEGNTIRLVRVPMKEWMTELGTARLCFEAL